MFRNTELLKIAACVPLGIFYSASTARNGRPILALLVVVVVALLGLVVDESAFVALGVVDRGACSVLGPGSPYFAP